MSGFAPSSPMVLELEIWIWPKNVLPAFTLCGSCVDTRMRWPVSLPPVPGQVLPPAEGLGGEACWVDLLWNCSNSCKTTSLSLRETDVGVWATLVATWENPSDLLNEDVAIHFTPI